MRKKVRKLARLSCRQFAVFGMLGWLAAMPMVGWAQQGTTAELFNQAQAYEDGQKYEAAEGIYHKVLASDPDNPEALKRLGILQQTVLKFDYSIDSFQHVLRMHADYPQVNFFLGLSYYGKRDFKDAIASFHRN